jgi:hypothetical protein
MIRFFRKGSRTAPDAGEASATNEPAPVVEETSEPGTAPEGEPAIEFELRKPTDEELSASFMSEQDFADIGKVMPEAIARPSAARPEPIDPGAGAAAPASAPDPDPSKSDGDRPDQSSPVILDEHDGEPLIGFWDGLAVGSFLTGWAGDPYDPSCRSIRVALYVDGSEVTSAYANGSRSDVEHGAFEIRVADTSIARLLLQDRIKLRASRDGRRVTDIVPLPQVIDMARDFRARELERAGEGAGPVAPMPKTVEELGPVLLPIGLPSPNSAAILGKDGYLFAYRGQFDVVGQYDNHGPAVELDSNAWLGLFKARNVAMTARNIVYLQTIQPEKATILPSLAPPDFGEITPRLALIESRIADQNRSGEVVTYYRSLVAPLRSCHQGGIPPFMRLSDGYRIVGSQLAFYQLLEGIAANMPDRLAEFDRISALCREVKGNSGTQLLTGELANQFMVPMYEVEVIPDLSATAAFEAKLAHQEQTAAGFTYRRWSNDQALSPLKIMLVGSACFGLGDYPRSIAWWFKSLFAEVTLLECDELPLDIVDRDKPDLVVCQTMERKLSRTLKA